MIEKIEIEESMTIRYLLRQTVYKTNEIVDFINDNEDAIKVVSCIIKNKGQFTDPITYCEEAKS